METILKIANKTQIIIILASLFTVLISLSCVSASSTVYVNTTGNDTIGNGSSENPYLTIQKGIDSLDLNGTIHLADGTYKDIGNTNLTINKNMTIIGQSKAGTIIDGQGQGSIFTINHGITVTFKNLTLSNASTNKNGGAINNNGTVTASNCNFNKDTATSLGGAIYNNGTLTVSNCNFTQNTAMGGGAIYNDGILQVISSTFNNNTAPNGVGGAIANYGNLNMTNCTFNNNSGWFYGGAIYNSKNLNMANCTFNNNTSEEGGAIYNYRTGVLNITKTSFNNNTVDYSNGGAIYNCGTLTITSSKITNNIAKSDGGAIYNNYGTLNVTNTNFTNNKAANGGAITNGGNGTLTVTLCQFTNNIVTGVGGAIENYGYHGNLTVINSSFTGNTAINGGAIDNDGNTNVAGSTFTGNTATWGGAVDNGIYGILILNNCIFKGNTATNGAAIYNRNNTIINSSNFNGNTATNCGVIANYIGSLTLTQSTFTDNTAHYGGSIYNNQGTLAVNSSTFTGNTATMGGAIYNDYGNVNIHFNRIARNTADQGSAIYNNNWTINATLNWWGSNTDPATIPNLIVVNNTGSVDASTWVILKVHSDPTNINNTKISTITADFNHINGGSELTGGHIPEGPITLEIPWGSLISTLGAYTPPTIYPVIQASNSGITHSITLDTVNGLVTATFYANEGTVNPLFNPVKVTAAADNYTTNNTESAYIIINKASDLYIKITSNKNNPKIGKTFTLTYKLGNKGPDEATNVTITIPLPEGFEISQITGDGNWAYNADTNTITWTLTNVPVGDPYLHISGYVNNPGTYIFSSSISSETYNINSQGVTPITINAVSEVKAASKTIPLQKTGLPVSELILAILAVFGGLVTSKRE